MGKTVYAVYARFNGQPAGFVGLYRTRPEAREEAKYQQLGCIIKRERVQDGFYQMWAQAGFRPRGWLDLANLRA